MTDEHVHSVQPLSSRILPLLQPGDNGAGRDLYTRPPHLSVLSLWYRGVSMHNVHHHHLVCITCTTITQFASRAPPSLSSHHVHHHHLVRITCATITWFASRAPPSLSSHHVRHHHLVCITCTTITQFASRAPPSLSLTACFLESTERNLHHYIAADISRHQLTYAITYFKVRFIFLFFFRHQPVFRYVVLLWPYQSK